MKYFPSDQGTIWSTKVNFVDENNVLVGYDWSPSCCEQFGWYIANNITTKPGNNYVFNDDVCENAINTSLKDWFFDTKYFQTISNESENEHTAVFRLVNGDNELFLHLYNHHNGYYSHGFDFAKDGEIIQTGYL